MGIYMQKLSTVFLSTVIICFILFNIAHSQEREQLALMPVPSTIEHTPGKFRVDSTFTIGIIGNGSNRLYKGATRTLKRLSERTGIFFSQDYITPNKHDSVSSMIIECKRAGSVVLKENESYSLMITPEKITLSAETDIGVLRGLETVFQLLNSDQTGYFLHTVSIEDSPRYPWRGLMIDASRHFIPVEVIKRNIDGMAAVKLNVLHWHLSEDQGFRVECKTFPKLHQLGSDGFYYTQEQIKEIVSYAAERGIRVMPEFDMPGHSTSWFIGYPELASAPGPYSIGRNWGVMDPTMDPTNEATYKFLDKFFKEMSQLFPDEYIHIGGDENNGKQWNANPAIQAFMKKTKIKDNHTLQSYFNKRILKILTKYKKKMIGWDEIFQPDLPTDVVIHSWRGRQAMEQSAKKGYQTILSNGYYIDLIQPTAQHYLNDPIPENSTLADTEKVFILGGEATMWSEYVWEESIDSRIWPRTAAIAERFWSPGTVKDVDDMYRRLDVISLQLEELGLMHNKNYDMMLRRLANGYDITPLKNLVDVIEPLKGYQRGRYRQYTSSTPLTRVVDTARPDAKLPREFSKLVDQYLSDPAKNSALVQLIREQLILWEENHSRLEHIINNSPILWEIKTLSEDLSRVSHIGIEALDMIVKGTTTEKQWIDTQLSILREARRQRGQTELMIIPAVEKMVRRTNIN
jgi:hexosaminidase